VVGAGGGTSIMSFAWGLRNLSNNLVEDYALLCDLSIAKDANIGVIHVYGDSMIIVKAILVNLFVKEPSKKPSSLESNKTLDIWIRPLFFQSKGSCTKMLTYGVGNNA